MGAQQFHSLGGGLVLVQLVARLKLMDIQALRQSTGCFWGKGLTLGIGTISWHSLQLQQFVANIHSGCSVPMQY